MVLLQAVYFLLYSCTCIDTIQLNTIVRAATKLSLELSQQKKV